jgi:tRNA wybutosine-synthesizing protein 2
MGFKEKLKEALKEDLTEEEISLLPGGFQNVGSIIILKLNPALLKKKKIIAEACLRLLPSNKAVYLNFGKIKGQFRKPEKIEFVVGEDNPIVEHKEHGVIYRFDITKIMFSKGNVNERKSLAFLVREGEVIVDMFAGIGYFSLPIAKLSKPQKIYSIEINPDSFRFLVENIRLNHLKDFIIPIHGDCKQEVIKLSKLGIKADRVIMGVLPAPKDYIKEALSLLKDKGTMYHYEGIIERENYLPLIKEFEEITLKENCKCEIISKRIVKSYGPHLYHAVLDILVSIS